MTMIDYYLLGARVSFCVCKNSCHVVQKLPCCLSGSSLSSDIATQVTCIVIAQCSSKFSSSDVVTCFLLSGGLVFLFPTHSFSLVSLPFFDTSVSGTSVRGRKRGCGDEYHRKFPTFKKKRECACLQGFTAHGLLHSVTWQLA